MRMCKDYMDHNYQINETEGPKYEEIMEIRSNINDEKANSSIIKPVIIKVGGK